LLKTTGSPSLTRRRTPLMMSICMETGVNADLKPRLA
jgi:hypothetical protein